MVAVLTVCLLIIGLPRVFGVSSQDASTAIANAEHALEAAFVNVSEAERAGVNVTGLLIQLDDAGYTLTAAEAALNSTPANYSAAVIDAVTSETLADEVAGDAIALKNAAGGSILFGFWGVLIAGFAGMGILVVILALTWVWFRRYYSRKLSKSHPKVTG